MKDLELTVPLPGNRPAVLTVPQPLTVEALHKVEQTLGDSLGAIRRDMCGSGADAGALEYASWMHRLQSGRTT